MNSCCVHARTVGLLALAAVGAVAVGMAAGRWSAAGAGAVADAPLPVLSIDATGSATGDEFSMATGPVSDEAEGVFVLDHATGLLQCNVLYPRTGQFGATFQANVKETLPAGGKNSKYLMVTGGAQFASGSNRAAANCVVYVLDQTSGAYACSGIPFNTSMVNSRAPQMGMLRPLAVGQARVGLAADVRR